MSQGGYLLGFDFLSAEALKSATTLIAFVCLLIRTAPTLATLRLLGV